MWVKVAEELAVPWRAAEAMHWQLGEADMARRAGVVPFSLTAANTSESSSSAALTSRPLAPNLPQDNSALHEMSSPPPPTSYSRSQLMSPMTSAQTPPQGHINLQSPLLQQPRREVSRQPEHSRPHPSLNTVVPSPATPQQPPSSPARTPILSQRPGEYRYCQDSGLTSIWPHSSSDDTGRLPSIAQLVQGISPYGPPSEPPAPTSLSATIIPSTVHYMALEQAGMKRPASLDIVDPHNTHRRRHETFLSPCYASTEIHT
jgi:hypothetical protein